MLEKYIDTISKTSLFNGIEKDSILSMSNCLKPKISSYRKNEYIVTAGENFRGVGIILEGELLVSKENVSGDRTIMTILKQGGIFGEVIAFSNINTWPSTVQAQNNCVILFISKDKIVGECSRLCPWHRLLINNFLNILSEKALILNRKVEYLTIKSIRGKISTYLLEQYKKTGSKNMTLPLNRNELADFLNVSRPSMSREICKMRDEGIIDFYRRDFKILDIESLKHNLI